MKSQNDICLKINSIKDYCWKRSVGLNLNMKVNEKKSKTQIYLTLYIAVEGNNIVRKKLK